MSEPKICPNCGIEVDDNGDGNCGFCGPTVGFTRHLPEHPRRRVRKSISQMSAEEFAEALADLVKVGTPRV